MDEAVLFFRLIPEKTICKKELVRHKNFKDRGFLSRYLQMQQEKIN